MIILIEISNSAISMGLEIIFPYVLSKDSMKTLNTKDD